VDKANSLYGKIKSFIGLYAGIQSLKIGLDTSDNLSQTMARLNLMNDGKQTTDQLQQAIFTISNLTKKQRRLLDYIRDNYVVPLKVNGKEVFEQNQADEMLKNLSELELVNQDIVALKDGINVANSENFIENKSLFALLEEVRLKRAVLYDLEYLLKRESTRVENGVGVVQYGVLNKKELIEKFDKLENEVNSLSEKIDSVNSKTEIEVKLVSSID